MLKKLVQIQKQNDQILFQHKKNKKFEMKDQMTLGKALT